MAKERTISTSISLEDSKLQKYAQIALTEGYRSRNNLIYFVLTDWLAKHEKAQKAR